MRNQYMLSLFVITVALVVGLFPAHQIAFADDDEIEIEIEIEEGIAEISVEVNDEKTKFIMETTDLEEILDEIELRTGLTRDEIEKFMEVEIDDERDDDQSADLKSLREENQKLREEIKSLQEQIANMQQVLLEQIKVIM